ncbi:pentatricopeptide repeat-containing protein [Striga asiatica]|uniref:Pentatricopeptide repeat-containing protein n=1 Tax=Striga asiatica TaxID=4170 RepID=A0A5A7QZN6_STRAF|nr:pentatricopeptide repeat-containing protein [Striga asiatica]
MSHLKALHAQFILRGLAHDPTSLSRLISFCGLSPSGDLQYAHNLFDKFPHPNRHMYNTLIRACSNGRYSDKAIFIYRKMVCSGIHPNEFTFPFVLKACAALKAYADGISAHLHAVKLGFHDSYVVVQNGLINFYVGCGKVEHARKVFGQVEFRTLVTWNSMIGGYAKVGSWKDAFFIFRGMWKDGVQPDGHTFVSLLSLCSRIYDVNFGRYVHWCIVVNGVFPDVFVQNALLDMYAKCGHLEMAEAVFARMVDKNVVSWTSMISAYAKHGLVELAEKIFERMPVKNTVSWNSMISCYLQNGYYNESLDLFYKMCDSRVVPDETTLVSALSACGHVGDLVSGKKLHDYLRDNSIQFTVTLCNSLVDMYAKCGSAELALDVFRGMQGKNIISWNIIINALALHGFGYQVIGLFQEMESGGPRPDSLTFLGLLSACCHCGLVEIGRYYFTKVGHVYKIPYNVEHYACMIDMLGRGGFLNEALELVGKMEMRADVVIWGTLLGACKIHQNVEIAKVVLKQVLELESGGTGGLYVLMSNIFSEARKWDEVKKMRKLMNDRFARKMDAVSSINVDGCMNSFIAHDKKNEASNHIYLMLDQMKDQFECVNDLFGPGDEFIGCF